MDNILTFDWLMSFETLLTTEFFFAVWLPTFIFFMYPLWTIWTFIYLSNLLAIIGLIRQRLVKCTREEGLKISRRWIATIFEKHGSLFHSYEVKGLDNIPDGPALLIFYHGTFAIDYFYLMSHIVLKKDRLLAAVCDRLFTKFPGIKYACEAFRTGPGTVESLSEILADGELLAILPGGAREGLFSGKEYKMIWGQRRGFAKVALNSKVPIVPIFTANINEATRCYKPSEWLARKAYEFTRMPIFMLFAMYPVKLTTYVGKPIMYDPEVTVDELAEICQEKIRNLISKHQQIPGSVITALGERFF